MDMPKKFLAQDLSLQIQLMDNRDLCGEPLRADEFFVQITRERYYTLCNLALGNLREELESSST